MKCVSGPETLDLNAREDYHLKEIFFIYETIYFSNYKGDFYAVI